MTDQPIKQLATRFRRFGEQECRGSSALYANLASYVADDDDLLRLAANTVPGQPVPNMLFGVVHDLLLQGKKHALADYYPSLGHQPKMDDGVRFMTNASSHYRLLRTYSSDDPRCTSSTSTCQCATGYVSHRCGYPPR